MDYVNMVMPWPCIMAIPRQDLCVVCDVWTSICHTDFPDRHTLITGGGTTTAKADCYMHAW